MRDALKYNGGPEHIFEKNKIFPKKIQENK